MLRRSFITPSRKEGPPSIWDTHGISGNVFVNPDASSSAPYPQELHQWNSSLEEPLHSSTVEKSERQGQDQDLRCQSRPSAKNSVILSGGDFFKELWGRPTTTADFGSSFRQIPYTRYVGLLEDKIQDRGLYLFTIPYGSYAMDQRSGDGWFSGWFKIFVINKRYFNAKIWSTWCERGLLQRWTESSIILTSKEGSVWRNKRPRSRTASFAADRLLTWLTNTSGSLEPTILSRTMPTYSLSVYEMTIFRNSTQSGRNFIVYDENPTWWYLGRIVQNKNTRVWETQDRIGIVWPGDSSEEVRTWLSQIENYGEKKYWARYSK